MRRPRFALRTIQNGSVTIRGRVFRPENQSVPYDGRLDGQRWAFGLYWGPANWDKYDHDGFASFVSLWGSAALYRGDDTAWRGLNCLDGRFQWEWWRSERGVG